MGVAWYHDYMNNEAATSTLAILNKIAEFPSARDSLTVKVWVLPELHGIIDRVFSILTRMTTFNTVTVYATSRSTGIEFTNMISGTLHKFFTRRRHRYPDPDYEQLDRTLVSALGPSERISRFWAFCSSRYHPRSYLATLSGNKNTSHSPGLSSGEYLADGSNA